MRGDHSAGDGMAGNAMKEVPSKDGPTAVFQDRGPGRDQQAHKVNTSLLAMRITYLNGGTFTDQSQKFQRAMHLVRNLKMKWRRNGLKWLNTFDRGALCNVVRNRVRVGRHFRPRKRCFSRRHVAVNRI